MRLEFDPTWAPRVMTAKGTLGEMAAKLGIEVPAHLVDQEITLVAREKRAVTLVFDDEAELLGMRGALEAMR